MILLIASIFGTTKSQQKNCRLILMAIMFYANRLCIFLWCNKNEVNYYQYLSSHNSIKFHGSCVRFVSQSIPSSGDTSNWSPLKPSATVCISLSLKSIKCSWFEVVLRHPIDFGGGVDGCSWKNKIILFNYYRRWKDARMHANYFWFVTVNGKLFVCRELFQLGWRFIPVMFLRYSTVVTTAIMAHLMAVSLSSGHPSSKLKFVAILITFRRCRNGVHILEEFAFHIFVLSL